ncbi:catalase HPII [Hymenobacter ginsengisoli]|uniref:Catalase n=1 Tax=Hymenobacter ginsengisoli TaxID=1051626 RepID=A0ABP8QM52_9BACT|nr:MULTISPECIES: catalase [unclassified Hymenobacter]MBO2033101.1 catalase [Hymenobacter sp. BT559]
MPDKPLAKQTHEDVVGNPKTDEMAMNREDGYGTFLTTNQGLRVNDDQNQLKAGERGPSLLEDFIYREKMTHFDHERIPERVVHARGVAAHGYFQAYDDNANLSRAAFLQPGAVTPVFTRFSTVAGSRGSSDLARDVRGFAVKFYTEEGVYDLVGNNMPVFFIQDAIKFPDFVHAVKPEPHNEIPQAASAHDTFYDFISINPETTHMLLWVMSDRSLPRSLRMMEGFGVHTFRLVNAEGKARFVKFHWKPLLGTHSIAWEEAQQISGKDPDFHRRDLWNNIEGGNYPEWELGVQVVEEEDERKFDFDILDATKLIPEEQVPVIKLGKMVLNRNVDNYFAETEQVAFCLSHIVPGVDFSNDPLLQGRLFSYLDTQLKRLGGPNFHEIPINRSLAPIHNNQRDGHMRQTINKGNVAYGVNKLNHGYPQQAKASEGGFTSTYERVEGHKIRLRSKSFVDHYSQARLFWNSQTDVEKMHIVKALRFELSHVQHDEIRERTVLQLSQVAHDLASRVAEGLGMAVPSANGVQLNLAVPADGNVAHYQSGPVKNADASSAALSIAADSPINKGKGSIKTRQIAILATDGADVAAIGELMKTLMEQGAQTAIVATHLGTLKGKDGQEILINWTFQNTASVLFDAVYVAGGASSVQKLTQDADAVRFVNEAFRHCKPIAASAEGVELLKAAAYPGATDILSADGVVTSTDNKVASLAKDFSKAIAHHRFWSRELKAMPA